MRLTWSDRALDELRDIHQRAPVQARQIVVAVDALVGSPFPWMYRRVEDRPGEHVLVV